jgi:hypothetical protein
LVCFYLQYLKLVILLNQGITISSRATAVTPSMFFKLGEFNSFVFVNWFKVLKLIFNKRCKVCVCKSLSTADAIAKTPLYCKKMTWISPNKNEYKLVLLDTNALSEIVENRFNSGKGFITNFSPDSYIPVFTIYNLVELRRDKKTYNNFLKFFSIYPCFLLKTQEMILTNEVENYKSSDKINILFNAFTPAGNDASNSLKKSIDTYFSNKEMMSIESNWRENESEILAAWLNHKDNFEPTKHSANNFDAQNYVETAELQFLCFEYPDFVKRTIAQKEDIDFNFFPSLKVMLYSQYYRLFDSSWTEGPQEVTDVSIMAAAPYVDVIIAEKFQANIFDKIRKLIAQLSIIEFHRLSKIRLIE